MIHPLPVVLVSVDKDSRLTILQHEGVQVAYVDLRVDPLVVLLPPAHQPLEIHEIVRSLKAVSIGNDDAARSAAETFRRIADREIVVAEGPLRLISRGVESP